MNTDANGRRHRAAGTSVGGQYAVQTRAEAGVDLLRPDHGPGDPLHDRIAVVGLTVEMGPLARLLVRDDRPRKVRGWVDWARRRAGEHAPTSERAVAYEQFAAGVEHALVALWSNVAEIREEYALDRLMREMGEPPPYTHVNRLWANHLMQEKRTSRASRAEYAAALHQVNGSMRRGMVVAGIVLCGEDSAWHLDGQEHDDAVFGPGPGAPD